MAKGLRRTSQLTVLVTEMFTADHLSGMMEHFPQVRFVQLRQDGTVPPAASDAEILFRCFMSKDELRRVLDGAPRLRWIHTCTAGFDQLLIPEIQDKQLLVTRSASAYNVPMSEFVMAYILAMAKRIPALVRSQMRHEWRPPKPDELTGRTVGIIGAGAIGTQVAQRCAALGMRVIGTKRTPEPLPCFEVVMPPSGLPVLLAESDYVVLASPLTPETRGMMAEAELRAMKPTAYLLNIARGALIDDEALIRALKEGWIAGACLDAFREEPLPPDSPLWDLENALITPHTSYYSPHGTERGIAAFEANLRRYLDGEPLSDPLKDARLGY
jgi:phosphoglycerate dehydrogenase-like enzyme